MQRMSGLVNLRDVGHLPVSAAAGGGETRAGVLFRSDAPLPGDAAPTLAGWPPCVIIDLRSGREAKQAEPLGGELHHIPLASEASMDSLMHAAPGTSLTDIYNHTLVEAAPFFARIAAIVAEATGAVLVHCTAGKDRTGVVVAALLSAVGVEREAIVADYLSTGVNMPAVIARVMGIATDDPMLSMVISQRPQVLACSEPAIRTVLTTLEAHEGGAGGWLIANGLAPALLDRLCDRLVV